MKVKVEKKLHIAPCLNNPAGTLPQAFARAVRDVRGKKPVFSVNRGFTDMHFFSIDGRLPAVGYGVKGQGVHAIDERVSIQDLLTTARVYAAFMTGWEGD